MTMKRQRTYKMEMQWKYNGPAKMTMKRQRTYKMEIQWKYNGPAKTTACNIIPYLISFLNKECFCSRTRYTVHILGHGEMNFRVLLTLTKFVLQLHFSDWFGNKRNFCLVPNRSGKCNYNSNLRSKVQFTFLLSSFTFNLCYFRLNLRYFISFWLILYI